MNEVGRLKIMANHYEQMTDEELYELAFALHEGIDDTEQDLDEAAIVLKIAADRDFAPALCDYGVYLMNGDGVEKDDAAAIEYWEKAAEQDFAPAQYKLGVCYMQGSCGVEKDEKKAAQYFTKAAEGGETDSMLNLSIFYGNGIGVEIDPDKSLAYLEQAAELDHPVACCYLGAALAGRKTSSKEDVIRGAKLLEKAAEMGHRDAQYIYGMCCENGRGVEKDLAEAAGWYRRAAKAGLKSANAALIKLGFPGVL